MNVFIYKSDINGTGKTFAIKKEIKNKEMKYKYFPFGGFLNKEIIYNKIKKLLDEVKNEGYNKISIHTDLYETEQQDLMNDFLFSFLYLKYYKNDEKVIYIPREISIYVEIPNCFRDFFETYPILKIYKPKQKNKSELDSNKNEKNFHEINSKDKPELDLNKDEKNLFVLLKIKDPKEFIYSHIGIENPSYYQIKQFINSFLCQITNKNYQDFLKDDIKNKRIQSTKHFTKNLYSDLLKENNKEDKDNNKDNNEDNKNEKSKITEKDILEKLSLIDNDISKKKEEEDLDKISLVFYNNKDKFFEVNISKDYYKDYKRKDYLSYLEKIFNLEYPVENNSSKSLDKIIGKEYVITADNFRKMVKIYYRIISNLNLIIMGFLI